MNHMHLTVIVIVSLLLSLPAHTIEVFEFDSEEQRTQFQSLAEELRCPVCQNQSLADSGAGLADDLRLEIFEQIQQGKNKKEIIEFMVTRYGDFIIYRPRFNVINLLLWTGPLLILLFGSWLLFQQLRKQQSINPSSDELNQDERQRLQDLLKDKDSGQ